MWQFAVRAAKQFKVLPFDSDLLEAFDDPFLRELVIHSCLKDSQEMRSLKVFFNDLMSGAVRAIAFSILNRSIPDPEFRLFTFDWQKPAPKLIGTTTAMDGGQVRIVSSF